MEAQPFGGARALATLHDRHLRAFLEIWEVSNSRKLQLPPTTNPHFATLDAILAHVLSAASSYLTWVCDKLDLPAPDLATAANPKETSSRRRELLESILLAWSERIPSLTYEQVEGGEVFVASWGEPFTIDGMLEHAVMHPIRHALQLERLLMNSTADLSG